MMRDEGWHTANTGKTDAFMKGASSVKPQEVLQQLNRLKREDETLYNMVALDVWALAQTMDEFQPGFWAAFMKNRKKAIQRFMGEVVKHQTAPKKRHPFLN